MVFKQLTLNEFKRAVLSEVTGIVGLSDVSPITGRSFLQSPEMYARYKALGREAYCFGVVDGEEIVAAGLAVVRPWRLGRKMMRVAGGWLMNYQRAQAPEVLQILTQGVKGFAKQHKISFVEVAPNIEVDTWQDTTEASGAKADEEAGADKGAKVGGEAKADDTLRKMYEGCGYKYLGEYESVKWIYELDLMGRTEQEIWEGFRQSHRRMVRKAEKEGVVVREVQESELSEMQKIMAETGERQGFIEQDLGYFQSMKKHFGDNVRYMVAMRGEEMLAVGMFVRDFDEMVYLYGGSRREGQKYGGSYLLQWEMIKEALRLGLLSYNFYGTHPVEGNGVYDFKRGFRGHVVELAGTYILPVDAIGKAYALKLKERKYGELR